MNHNPAPSRVANPESRTPITARALVAGYRPGQRVLAGVDLTVAHGEFVCVLGPNGSGKSTLLRCLLGLLQPQAGEACVEGESISDMPAARLARAVAYVPQTVTPAFAYTVREVVLTGRYAHGGLLGLASPADRAAADEAMGRCHVAPLADRLMGELSGGEAQCVMIARAVAQQTGIVLLDEPTSHLDLKNQAAIYRLMQSLAHDHGKAVLCVSHDVNLAARFADRLVMMNSGHILADGAPEVVLTESNLQAVYETAVRLLRVAGERLPMVVVA